MSSLRFYGDPVLRRKARPIRTVDGSVRALAEEMIRVMRDARGIGLAANQVGEPVQLLVTDPSAGDEEEKPSVLLNPRIVSRTGAVTDEEGCLSFPGLRIPVKRALEIRVEGQDLSGNPTALEARGVLARVLQHEIDHLNAVLFVDRLPLLKRIAMLFKLSRLKRRYRRGGGSSNREGS